MTNEEFLGMNIPELDELMGMMPAGMDTDALITLSRKSYEAGQAIARRNKSGEWHYPSKKEWPEPGREVLMYPENGTSLMLGWYDGLRWGNQSDLEVPEPSAWQYPELPLPEKEGTVEIKAMQEIQGGEKRFCETTGKICYSRREAGNILNYTKRNKFGRNIPKRCFFCEDCGTWHLTHLTRFGERKTKKKIRRIR